MPERSYWIGVASREHVQRGVAEGFCQLGHGKHAPVKRLSPGDLIVYYSPRETLAGGEPVQAFTGIGEIRPGEAYLVAMTPTFSAYRRDVAWWPCREAAIAPLIAKLSFIKAPTRWGFPFRRGSFKVSGDDFKVIADAMGVQRSL